MVSSVIDGVLIAQRRVLRHVNAVLSMPGRKVRLLQVRMAFVLVDSGHNVNVWGGEQALEFGEAEVGDADGAGFSCFHARLHGAVGAEVVGGAAEGRAGDGVLGEEGGAAGEGAGPVHEVEVYVGRVEVTEGGVERGGYIVRVVSVVPELGGDEEVRAGDAGFLDGGADGGLGAVYAGGVDVAVAGL